MSTANLVEESKKLAAFKCVDDNIKSGQVIGIGTGSTIVYAVQRIAEKFRSGQLQRITCIPTSFQARQLIVENALPSSDLEHHYSLNICIDGADEVDADLNCIKGGGACLTQEKIVMSCARRFFVVADYRKKSTSLGTFWKYIPIEVVPMAWRPIKARIENTEGGSLALRIGTNKAGPVVTDNGNFVLDWRFPLVEPGEPSNRGPRTNQEWTALNQRLSMIPGLVDTGLFIGMAEKGYFGMEDGSVEVVHSPENSPARGLYAVCDGNHSFQPTKASRQYLLARSMSEDNSPGAANDIRENNPELFKNGNT